MKDTQDTVKLTVTISFEMHTPANATTEETQAEVIDRIRTGEYVPSDVKTLTLEHFEIIEA